LVWANAPKVFRYNGYDDQTNLVVTGLLSVVFYPNTGPVSGFLDFQRADGGTNYIGEQIGQKNCAGFLSQNNLTLSWPSSTAGMALQGKLLGTSKNGRLVYTNFSGTWGTFTDFPFLTPPIKGTFSAQAIN